MIALNEQQVHDVLRQLLRGGYPTMLKNPPDWPFEVGSEIMVRAIPLYYCGIVVGWTSQVLTLTCCSWVADTGKFDDFWVNPTAARLRPYPEDELVHVGIGGISDWCKWKFLPKVEKTGG